MPRIARQVTSSQLPIRELQLAQLVEEPPEGPLWFHEQKFDGYRILADFDRGTVRLMSRRFKDWTAEFPTVVQAVAELPVRRAILDGEVAVLLPDGRTSFQGLQNSFGATSPNLVYFVFDVLAIDDEILMSLPLEERKARLEKLVTPKRGVKPGVLRYSDHVIGNGKQFYDAACKIGLEGIVSKRRDKPYLPGRSANWQKTKCLLRQELVIGGFTDPEGHREGIGALLMGYYDGDRLVYAGKVGTGYTHKMLGQLRELLEPDVVGASPFSPEPPRAWTGPNRHWVKPVNVAEVSFGEWTDDGRLRHPSFQGLRVDKDPREVVREAAKEIDRE
jgi:bifunctional non-homologous end joining protein LigD